MAGLYNKQSKPKKAPKVHNPHPEKPYFQEGDIKKGNKKVPQWPLKAKKLSK